MVRTLTVILVVCLLNFTPGCQDAESGKISLAEQVQVLTHEKTQLNKQLKQFETETRQLKKQVQVLSGLPEDKLENLYRLQRVKIHRYTNFYDKDNDGQKEKLIVYIQPIDEEGDIVKATGSVDVQLWDLDKNGSEALLGQWHVKPGELRKLWFATILTINYRLTFDVVDIIEDFNKPFTVKVAFTDYLSGKIFKEQHVIKPL